MGNILKKDASVVEQEKKIAQLESDISTKQQELKALAEDLKMAQLFDDTQEIDDIKVARDNIISEISQLQKKLAEVR
ncbi:MAG: hypothetical protein ACQEQF_00325 [Bacillota bacterium]